MEADGATPVVDYNRAIAFEIPAATTRGAPPDPWSYRSASASIVRRNGVGTFVRDAPRRRQLTLLEEFLDDETTH